MSSDGECGAHRLRQRDVTFFEPKLLSVSFPFVPSALLCDTVIARVSNDRCGLVGHIAAPEDGRTPQALPDGALSRHGGIRRHSAFDSLRSRPRRFRHYVPINLPFAADLLHRHGGVVDSSGMKMQNHLIARHGLLADNFEIPNRAGDLS
jgi:hypothetical protein